MRVASSFRGRLALRFGLFAMLLTVAASALAYIALRHSLYGRLDAVLRRLAEIEAAATADSPDENVHFHAAVFQTPESEAGTGLTRYGEVWTLDGRPVVRTDNLQGRDLPLPESVRERVVSTQNPELFAVRWNGSAYRSFLYPLVLVGEQHRPHLLQVVASTRETRAVLQSVLRLLAGLVLFGMIGGSAAGWWLAGYAVRPVVEITRQAEAFEVKRQRHRIAAQPDTVELSRLVTVLNAMLGRIDETLDLQRRFLADAGHSMKTPLTILRGDIDVALRHPRSANEYQDVLSQSLTDLKDVSNLADDLITLARSDGGALEPQLQEVDVSDLFFKTARKFRSMAQMAGLHIRTTVDSDFVIEADPVLLDRALGNVVDNAIKHGAHGDQITLSASRGADGWVTLAVSDGGPGIPPERLKQSFDRFYRGDPDRQKPRGSGLGLPIAKAIVESHKGKIDIRSEPGKGTTVTFRIRQYASTA